MDADPFIGILTRLPELNDAFENLAPLAGANGHFSRVLSGRDRASGRHVVLKFMDPFNPDPYRQSCFARESEIGRLLRGRSGIVQLVGGIRRVEVPVQVVGDGASLALPADFIVLERGRCDLAEYLLLRAPGMRRRLELGRNVVLGVNQLHGLGFCHRDIKPENVVVFSGGIAKIGDLGTARKLDASDPPILATPYLAPMGDVRYVAPELLFGGWSDRALYVGADWFSVGSVIFEAVTGVPLYSMLGLSVQRQTEIIVAMQRLPPAERARKYRELTRSIAGGWPIPPLGSMLGLAPHLRSSHPETLLAVERLIRGLCHFDVERRTTDFALVLQRLDLSLAMARRDERAHAQRMLRGRGRSR